MKIKLMTLVMLAGLALASCNSTDRKDASTADSNRIDTNRNAASSNANMNDGSMGDTTGMTNDSTDTTSKQ
ncbi:hypothetical protein [Pedobacter namyangjuensis]|uniref:hypothetical protein n=1 Tax=Pedobacter namyangjuensis TaxID=600626 RepID=UPI000DE2D03A|nr:hypothetical protein [Pedobacter namyangjuensis]